MANTDLLGNDTQQGTNEYSSGGTISPNQTIQFQVEALITYSITTLTTPTTLQLSQFAQDAIRDITFKWVGIKPTDAYLFQRVTAAQVGNGYEIGTAKVLYVVRESETNKWRNCRRIGAESTYEVTDVESIHYASKHNPAFHIDESGSIDVYPIATVSERYKVYFLNVIPIEETPTPGNTFDRNSTGARFFPDHLEYLIALYASIRSLEAKIGEYAITEEDNELVQSLSPLLAAYREDYNQAFMFHAPRQKAQA